MSLQCSALRDPIALLLELKGWFRIEASAWHVRRSCFSGLNSAVLSQPSYLLHVPVKPLPHPTELVLTRRAPCAEQLSA